ncbi:Cytosine deaminase FCY1 [Trachipleistophora hominis]|uniref:Cytosine deaminase FCY1 n=1 Tax=Trachipleistophora hominis TaxID=72359 RepID=L7JWE5_TRAHO|nr:Cytosine deaminase FCY1 [Trachipleistophora hominis]
MTSNDVKYYMKEAINEAKKALIVDEVPVGCVFVRNGNIISKSHNLTNKLNDPLAHAEIVGIRSACCKNCDVYLTCEPCVMCFGVLKRLNCTIYFGCFNPIFGCSLVETSDNVFLDNQECVDLLKLFYKNENSNAPIEKRKIKTKR